MIEHKIRSKIETLIARAADILNVPQTVARRALGDERSNLANRNIERSRAGTAADQTPSMTSLGRKPNERVSKGADVRGAF